MGRGDDAQRHIGPDLAHDVTMPQGVDRDLRRMAHGFPIAQATPVNHLLEGPIVVRILGNVRLSALGK
jgi:hypothetical protein